MPDLVGLLGIRLQLLIGREVPRPAPYEVVDSLIELTVTNRDRDGDGFQMDFTLGKDPSLEYGLLRSGILDVPNRVIIVAIFGALPQVLIDGLITDHQVIPSNEPGRSTLRATGEDLSVKLSFEDRNATYRNQSDSTIVRKILADAKFVPQVTDTTDTPHENDRTPTQQCDNLRFVRQLARRNGFIFYVEPTAVPSINIAYWGPEKRDGRPQPALTLNMGPLTNVDSPINFHFDALGPAEPEVSILEPFTKRSIKLSVPSALVPSLTTNPTRPLRKTIARDTANLSIAQALLRALTGASPTLDAIEANGELDAVRYGRALRPRRLVDVRGAGKSYDGAYYVREVVHTIRRLPRGEYRQRFALRREGRGASRTLVVPAPN